MNILSINRYTAFDLPGYRYIPKQGLHPSKIIDKVHIPELPKSSIIFSEQTWKESERYLYAIDLFNQGYYWEVHEVLEKIWLKLGRKSIDGVFLQGLIQLSVSALKKSQGNVSGANRLLEKGLAKIQIQSGTYLGIKAEELISQFIRYINEANETPPLIALYMD